MVSKSAMNLILGFVGKTHATKMCRAFDLTSFGAFSCFMPHQHAFGQKFVGDYPKLAFHGLPEGLFSA
ncbi:hypothetical protein BCT77_18470 [Vibrio breoganii]|nr:hypothetical protein BCT77_18470 [Vibrio breoganii]